MVFKNRIERTLRVWFIIEHKKKKLRAKKKVD
jgi:hypothetical protein